jgi:TPR repeat protein
MDESSYWDTYHRSEGTRFFHKVGKESAVFAASINLLRDQLPQNSKLRQSYYAHTGGYKNPYSSKKYRSALMEEKEEFKKPGLPIAPSSYFYNRLLNYKLGLCYFIEQEFSKIIPQKQKNNEGKMRPIVYVENSYPCIMVHIRPMENPSDWYSHDGRSKAFQKLLMAYFIAFVNYNADQAGLPIETVSRSSFGQFLPSVAETIHSFRINIGIVPLSYAEVIVDSLVQLYRIFQTFNDKNSQLFSSEQRQKLGADAEYYNKKKQAEYSDRLKEHTEGSRKQKPRQPQPIQPKENIWEMLRTVGDSVGKWFLSEMFREQAGVELLSTLVLEELYNFNGITSETPILKVVKCFEISNKDTVTFQKNQLKELATHKKRSWNDKTIRPIHDDRFWDLIKAQCTALGGDETLYAPRGQVFGLYAYLEKLHGDFKRYYRVPAKKMHPENDDPGSSSEEEGPTPIPAKEQFFTKKITYSTGMIAIAFAYYAAKKYLYDKKGYRDFNVIQKYMYYETEYNLGPAIDIGLKESKQSPNEILFFDLNYCNAKNEANKHSGNELLKYNLRCEPTVIILDYTSATTLQINQALEIIARKEGNPIELILLISSGLKNENGGCDDNPYGTLRIFTRTKEDLNEVYKCLIDAGSKRNKHLLNGGHYLLPIAHDIRRAYKQSGFVPTNKNLLAIGFYKQAIAEKDSGKFLEALNNFKIAAERSYEPAFEEIYKILQGVKLDPAYRNEFLIFLIRQKNKRMSIAKAYLELLNDDLSHPASLYVLGRDHFDHGRAAAADKCFKDAAELKYPPAYLWLYFLIKFNYVAHNIREKSNWETLSAQEIDWFQKAARTGQAEAQANLALCYQHGLGVDKNQQEAFRLWTLAANQNHAYAQWNLGICYEHGLGVDKKGKKAVQWYTAAAEQGYADAQFNLGVCYANGTGVAKDEQKAVEWCTAAAEQGNADGQFNLGMRYANGTGVAKDEQKAVQWYTAAAEQGNAGAQFNLGVCYADGTGVAKDEQKAVQWYTAAAEQGDADGQFNLGVRYANGTGVAKDEQKAVQWYTAAAEQGHAGAQSKLKQITKYLKEFNQKHQIEPKLSFLEKQEKEIILLKASAEQGKADAQYMLGNCYKYGFSGVVKDGQKAMQWYHLAAEQGHADAQFKLGDCYKNGFSGVVEDEQKAMQWYHLAAEQGHADAQCKLGICYTHGSSGVVKDEQKAIQWYHLAAEQRHAYAQYKLALWYEYGGTGIEKNLQEAARLYGLAAAQGAEIAKNRLDELIKKMQKLNFSPAPPRS